MQYNRMWVVGLGCRYSNLTACGRHVVYIFYVQNTTMIFVNVVNDHLINAHSYPVCLVQFLFVVRQSRPDILRRREVDH